MTDIVRRVPELSFIDMREVFVFARGGRLGTGGPLATCHCLTVPDSDPGYYFWRDHRTGKLTRRTEVFVTRQPSVVIDGVRKKYLVSFLLPRFCDQSLAHSHKARFYRRSEDAWVAKLDTVVHELYHVDPSLVGIRQIARQDGRIFANCHGGPFFERVAAMVNTYLTDHPDPGVYEFLRHPFRVLEKHCGGIVGTAFRPYPSYPRPYADRAADADYVAADLNVDVEPWKAPSQRRSFTERDLEVRCFGPKGSRRVTEHLDLTGDYTDVLRAARRPRRRRDTPARRAEDARP